MKPVILANENFPRHSVMLLKKAGFEVVSIAEQSPGIADSEVLAQACRNRYLKTCKGFSLIELIVTMIILPFSSAVDIR